MTPEHLYEESRLDKLERQQQILDLICIGTIALVAVIGFVSLMLFMDWLAIPLVVIAGIVYVAWMIVGFRIDRQINAIFDGY